MHTGTWLPAATLLDSGLTPLALGSSAAVAAAGAKYADDFNGDGDRDLVLGDRTATVGGEKQAGAVVVVRGTAHGLDLASGRWPVRTPRPFRAAPRPTTSSVRRSPLRT